MHPNEKVLRDVDDAQAREDLDAFRSHFSDDVVVHVTGHSSLAGRHEGLDRFMELFGRFSERVPDYTFEPHAYLADDEHGVSLQRSHYKRGDETLESNEIFVTHFRDGKITEVWFLSENSDDVDAFLG
jgi:ketosteroid isomerase-like protein